MATTYKDYYIYYNGSLIRSEVDTGLTAVNIYYNGTYLGEGAHTLNCGGQYMNGNITIGNRTLNCAGQYMNGNVQVTVENRYKWYRYAAHYGYYQYTRKGPLYYGYGDLYTWLPDNCYISGKDASFNSSNGYWTITGGYNEYISSRYGYSASYFARNGSNYDNIIAVGSLYGSRDSDVGVHFYVTGSSPNATYEYGSAGTWYQDGLQEIVWSRDPNAHSDGPDGSGSWYVAI